MGPDQMLMTGCGESEVYVRSCGNRDAALPNSEAHQPVTEAEAKFPSAAQPPFNAPGCAWSRKQNTPAPRAGSAPQPKWLSDP
jgi:hypothetical protein